MTATEQLHRLLYILPVAAREEGVSLDELARALECDVDTILEDLEEATAREFYKPPGSVHPFSILIEEGRVYVLAPDDFNRPPRLTQEEGLALTLGLRMLAAEADARRRAEILALAERLEQELVVPPLQLQPSVRDVSEAAALYAAEPVDAAIGEDEVRGRLGEAIDLRRYCRITYLKPGAQPADRRIAPHSLIYTNGRWYVAAQDAAQQEARLFRIDRTTQLIMEHEQFAAIDSSTADAVAQRGLAYVAAEEDTIEVTVRYSRKVSRWISERMPAVCEPDGSALVTHSVADPNWLVRHVLQYAGEAVVETPALRRAVAEAAARLSA